MSELSVAALEIARNSGRIDVEGQFRRSARRSGNSAESDRGKSWRRGLNTAAAESTSEEAIGESAGCSKIRELSDRVRLSGVCSVKLALAHRIAPDRAAVAATSASATSAASASVVVVVVAVPRDEGLF